MPVAPNIRIGPALLDSAAAAAGAEGVTPDLFGSLIAGFGEAVSPDPVPSSGPASPILTPAKAGVPLPFKSSAVQPPLEPGESGIPAFAGMTGEGETGSEARPAPSELKPEAENVEQLLALVHSQRPVAAAPIGEPAPTQVNTASREAAEPALEGLLQPHPPAPRSTVMLVLAPTARSAPAKAGAGSANVPPTATATLPPVVEAQSAPADAPDAPTTSTSTVIPAAPAQSAEVVPASPSAIAKVGHMIAAAKLDGETEDQVVSLPSPRGQLSLERKPELPQANLPQRPVAVPTAAPSFRPTELASLGGLLVASEKPVTPAHARSVDALASVPLNVFASPQGVAPAEALQPVRAPDAAEIVIEQQLDMAAEGEWLDQLARDIASAGPDAALLRFRLNPETLGSLRVEIRQDQGGTAVRFTADNETARTLIAEAQPRLIAEARAQGIRVSETHVDLGGGQGSGDPRRQQAGFEEPQLRTARLLQEGEQSDGNPTAGRSERYA